MNKKTKKYLQLFLIVCISWGFVFFGLEMNAQTVEPSPSLGSGGSSAQCQITASKGTVVNINGIAECIENRYGFDKDALRRSKKKGSAPKVEIQFSNTDPVEGEEITAMAIPTHFTNPIENLYFTWSIVHFDGSTQLNSTMAGIHEAMGKIARGKFDPCLFGVDTDCDGSYDVPDTDNDGYFAPMGGADGVGSKEGDSVGDYDDHPSVMFDEPKQLVRTSAITRCYDHNFGRQFGAGIDEDAGRDMIVDCFHKFYNCPGAETGDGSFGLAEEQCWRTNPQNPDTDGDGVRDEADVAGLGQMELTWTYREGDRVSLWVEGTSMIPINEGGIEMEALCEYEYEFGTETTYDAAMRGCRDAYLDGLVVDTDVPEVTGDTTGSTDPVTGDTTGSTTTPAHIETTDYTGVAQAEANYDNCVESIIQVCEREGLDFDDLDDEAQADAGRTNAYYKIMWATPGFDEDGFNYMELVSVDERDNEILDPELEFYPKNPQYEQANPSESDLITVAAAINNEDVDDSFLNYVWSIRLCEINDPFECPEDVTDLMEYESFTEGLGIKKLIFRPRDGAIFNYAFSSNRAWLKVSVVVSQHGEHIGEMVMEPPLNYFPIGAVDHVMIPVTRNDMNISIFRAVMDPATGTWILGDEICMDGLYQDICPLYPNEILAAVVDAPTGSNLFSWQINGFTLDPPIDCVFSAGCDQYGPVVFFTVDGSAKDTGTITVTAKRNSSNDLISERLYSIYNPLAVINSSGGASPAMRFNGMPAQDIFEAPMGTRVSFTIDELVPNYIDFSEVNIEWYLNAEQVFDGVILRPEFVDRHGYLNVAVSADRRTIEFDLNGTFGAGYEVKARIERPVPPEEIDVLERAWRILDAYNLTQDRSISVKVAYAGPEAATTSLQQFFASSFANAPVYLILIIRLSIAMVLVWSIFFGMTYAVRLNYK